jgi:Holliday junction resolvase RusA-like endonuclease
MGDRYVKGRVFKKLTIISRRKRLIDQDNLCAKMLIDAIKELGWIADDSVAKCDITVRQIKSNEHDTCIELR